MKIVSKGKPKGYEWVNRNVLSDVTAIDHPIYGWEYVSIENGYRVVYDREHWEPFEEWVDIQVPKGDLRRLQYFTNTIDGCDLKWRHKP